MKRRRSVFASDVPISKHYRKEALSSSSLELALHVLDNHCLFANISHSCINNMISHMKPIIFKKQQLIFRNEDHCCFYIIENGTCVESTVYSEYHECLKVGSLLKRPHTLGDAALLSSLATSTVFAHSQVRLLALESSIFSSLRLKDLKSRYTMLSSLNLSEEEIDCVLESSLVLSFKEGDHICCCLESSILDLSINPSKYEILRSDPSKYLLFVLEGSFNCDCDDMHSFTQLTSFKLTSCNHIICSSAIGDVLAVSLKND